jgi:DNA-binding transcriptional LysR family regulator
LLVERQYGSKIAEAIMDNLADFGFTQLPIQDRKLQVVKIHSDEIKVVAPAGHPLAGKKAATAEDLIPYPLLLPKYGSTRVRLNEWLELVEDSIHIAMELDSSEMIKRFVMAGLGLSFLAASNCVEDIRAGRLAALSIAPEPMVRRLGLVYRKDKALSKAAMGFIGIVLENAGIEDRAPRGGEVHA